MDLENLQIQSAEECLMCCRDQILEIRNLTRDGFVSQETITKEEHYKFMDKYVKDYFIIGYPLPCVSCIDEVVGFVGVVDGDIRFAIRPEYQGRGLGKKLLNFIREKYPDAIGKVKINNSASSIAFTKAGFQVWFSDERFIYFTSKNVMSLSATELHNLYNKYLMRCVYCGSVCTKTIDGLAVCAGCIQKSQVYNEEI